MSRLAWPERTPSHERRRRPRDTGSVAVELTILAPTLIILLLFVVAVERLTSARLTVQEAAHQAARTATLTRNPTVATRDARATALAVTTGKDLPCNDMQVTVDVPARSAEPSAARTASTVATVRVACTVTLTDLTGLHLPSRTVIVATATSPLDRYKGGNE